jgi:hypothetical protein
VIIRAVLAALSAVPPHTPMRTAGRAAAGAQIIMVKQSVPTVSGKDIAAHRANLGAIRMDHLRSVD